jgi:Bacterial inner membrane protein
MDNGMINWIGWVATGVFAVSYFCRQPKMLRMVQAIAALTWVTYGFLIGAMPVVVANVIVALAAVYSSFAPVRNAPTTPTT